MFRLSAGLRLRHIVRARISWEVAVPRLNSMVLEDYNLY